MRKVLVLATACLLMTSCVIDKREMVSAEDQYNKEFVKLFGETDPNHTWSMVENKKVEVNLTKPSNVKVYVKSGENYHLAADYQDVSGSQQLSFDAPMGCEDVYVTVDGMPYSGAGSRTSVIPEGNVIIKAGTEYREYTYEAIKAFEEDDETLPERVDNSKNENLKLDYRVSPILHDEYTFYPLFWNAHYSHTFGLYYLTADGTKHEFDFYKNKEGDELQYWDKTDQEWKNVEDNYVFNTIRGFDDEDNKLNVLRCKPYTMQFPENTKEFGFYVIVHETNAKYYSNPALNGANSFSSFAYLQLDGNTYITIEDRNNDDFDYNDFIFVMEGEQIHIEDDPVEYIYAVEDLGNKDDFDFNDVVFSVSHVIGQPHATVKPLAAGGTLPAWICFNGNSCGGKVEVHARFKDSAGKPIASNVMVNTADGTTKANMKQASPFVVQVGTNWSHAEHNFTKEGNGFGVMVQNEENVTHVTPGNKPAPQILILPAGWLWPTERTPINTAYPNFVDWGKDYTKTTWLNNTGSVVRWY